MDRQDIELEYRHELRPLYRTRRDTTDPVSILSTIGADKNPFTLPNDLGQAGCGRELGSFSEKAGKFLTKAKEFSEFDVFSLKLVTFQSERDVNASLQVMTASTHDVSAFGLELQNPDHVTFSDRLPGIRRILLNLDDDHVKLRPELPCTNVIVSNFA